MGEKRKTIIEQQRAVNSQYLNPTQKRSSTVGQYGSNVLRGVPPLLSSESPNRLRTSSVGDKLSLSRSRTSNKRKTKKISHLRTQLVSFVPEDSLDEFGSNLRTNSAPSRNRRGHDSSTVSAPTSHHRRSRTPKTNEESSFRKSKHRRRPGSRNTTKTTTTEIDPSAQED